MGSLTQSLLSASADKTAETKSDMEKSQADPLANKAPKKTAQPPAQGAGTSATPAPKKPSLPKLPGAAKVGAVGAAMGSFHDGGTVPKTGPYILHEGEEVIPASRASEYRKVYLGRKSKKD